MAHTLPLDMTLPSIYRQLQVEVWEHPTRTRPLKRLALVRDVLFAEAQRQSGQVDTLTLRMDPRDPAAGDITDHRILRTQKLGGTDVELWRIVRVKRVHASEGTLALEVSAEALWGDLGRAGMVRDVLDEVVLHAFERYYTPTSELAALCLEGYRGGVPFVLGSFSPAEGPELLSFAQDTPLSALWKMATAAEGRLRFSWADGVGYTVSMEAIADGLIWNGAEVHLGKNLHSLSRDDELPTAATNFYATGQAGLSLAYADWVVKSAGAGSLVLTDDHGARGPIPADGWLIGYRVRPGGSTGAGVEITNSAGSENGPTTLSVSDTSGFLAGARAELLEPDGTRLAFVPHPSEEVHGPLGKTLTTETAPHGNILFNPSFTEWSASLPGGWEHAGGGSVLRVERATDPDRVKIGKYAPEVLATGEGQGIRSAFFTWRPTARLPVLSIACQVVTSSGRLQMYLEDAGGNIYPGDDKVWADQGSSVDPFRHTLVYSSETIPAGEYRVVIVSSGGAALFLVDAATASAAEGGGISDVTVDGGPQRLWLDTVRVAQEECEPVRTYEVELIHLYQLDPVKYAESRLEVDRELRVYDEKLGVAVASRITQLTERLDSLEITGSVELSNERRDVRDLLGGRVPNGGGTPPSSSVRSVVKPTRLVYRDPAPAGLTVLEFGIGKGKVIQGGTFGMGGPLSEFDPYFLQAADVPDGWMPTATLRSGVSVPVSGVLKGHAPFSFYIFTVEPFQADLGGDTLLITVPPIRGVIEGSTFALEIQGAGNAYVPGGECGPGYIQVIAPDGSYQCVPETEIHFPDPATGLDFIAENTGPGAGDYTMTGSATSASPSLSYTWEIEPLA